VEVETADGVTGVGVSAGGPPGAWIVEKLLAPLVEGRSLDAAGIADTWDRIYGATLPYGRRGLALHAVSAVDLALWDALGRTRAEPVWAVLGGSPEAELTFYATSPAPERAAALGFAGGKLPLRRAPAEGDEGLEDNVERIARARQACGDGFFIAVDCWMALDLDYAVRLAGRARELGVEWLEECLPPDDYEAQARLRREVGGRPRIATGEHESTRWGFKLLLDYEAADILQPDLGWCGGLTEAVRVAELCRARGVQVVPHGSGAFGHHLLFSQPGEQLAEHLIADPESTEVQPQHHPLLLGEPAPREGRLKPSSAPGFGIELNAAVPLERPFVH
jgi:L-rhamnonate dehydratase